MIKTTPPAPVDALSVLPELANNARTTIRLYLQRGAVAELSASKLGGLFLWPSDQPWPLAVKQCSSFLWGDVPIQRLADGDPMPLKLVPVLQLNAKDVPEFPFPPERDLFQLFWQPTDTYENPYWGTPFVIWRNSQTIINPHQDMPDLSYANPYYIPRPCALSFETVTEYPPREMLTDEQRTRLKALDVSPLLALNPELYEEETEAEIQYQWNLSVCPGNKLGGYVFWHQDPEVPLCDHCHLPMEHLLTLTDHDVDAGTWVRWLAAEDRESWRDPWKQEGINNAAGWQFGAGSVYYFICRSCEGWPVNGVYQR